MSVASAIRRMLEAGLTVEQALVAVEAFEAENDNAGTLTKRQERNRRYYENKKASEKRLISDNQDVSDAHAPLSSPEGSPPTPPSPKPHQSIPPSPPKGGSSPAGFADFWSVYPHKVGKPVAEKAFGKALRRADFQTIMAGLNAYVGKTDDRHWCNPSTWLNQDRWNDSPSVTPLRRSQAPPVRERTIFDAIDDFTGKNDHGLSAGKTIEHDNGGDYPPHVHVIAPPQRGRR